MIRLDLHVHSNWSFDSTLSSAQIKKALRTKLDVIAITDHNSIDQAMRLQNALGNKKIIVGEEISTKSGDIIGLFLTKLIKPGLSIEETVEQIKEQGGIVYIPHPFEQFQRRGLRHSDLERIYKHIDVIEVYNLRTISLIARFRAQKYAKKHKLAISSASDAHGASGLGRAYSIIDKIPTKDNLVNQLKTAKLFTSPPNLSVLAEPAIARKTQASTSRKGKR